MKLCTKFERNRAIRSIVIAILVFDLMTLNILRYVLRSVVWPSTTYPCLNYSVFDADTLCHAVTLTFNLLILNFYSTSGSCVKALYKIWAKSNSPPLSYWRFSPFSLCNFRGIWGTTDKRFSGVCGPNFTKLGVDIGRPFLHKNFFQRSDILLHFQMRAAQSWVMLKTTPNFALFDHLWKLGALPTTRPPKYIWWPSTAWLLSAEKRKFMGKTNVGKA